MLNDLALIILNFNSADNTIKCVENLIGSQADYHIIIVDNQSSDDSYEKLALFVEKYKKIDLLQTKSNGGYSTGNNYGIHYAKQKYNINYVAILNPDVLIPNIIVFTRLLDVLKRNEKIAIIGASAINAKNEYNPNFSSWDIPSPKELVTNHFLFNKRRFKTRSLKLIEKGIAQTECVTGCFFIAKLKILEEINLLDENVFLYNEENILGIKLKRAGYIEAVALDTFYIHNHKNPDETGISFKRKIHATSIFYKSRKYLCCKYYSKKYLPLLWFVEQLNRCLLAGLYFRKKIVNLIK